MKESLIGVEALARKKGIRTHKDSLIDKAEKLKDEEFKAEEDYILAYNDMIKARNKYKFLAKVSSEKHDNLDLLRRHRYEAICRLRGTKPLELEEDAEE